MPNEEVTLKGIIDHVLKEQTYLSEKDKEWQLRMQKRFARQMSKLPVIEWLDYLDEECPDQWLLSICYWVTRLKMFRNGKLIREVGALENTKDVRRTVFFLFWGGLRNLILLDPPTFSWWFERIPTKWKKQSLGRLSHDQLLSEKQFDFSKIPNENVEVIINYYLESVEITKNFVQGLEFSLLMKLYEMAIRDKKHFWKVVTIIRPYLESFYSHDAKHKKLNATFEALYGKTEDEFIQDDDEYDDLFDDSDEESEEECKADELNYSGSDFEAVPMEV